MKTTPFWWEDAPPEQGLASPPPESPSALIVGAGYTGLSAAITLAEAGMSNIVVIDAGRIGEGASSRNGGQIGNGAKFTLKQAERRFGPDRARQIMEDYDGAMPFLLDRAKTLSDDFDLNLCGAVTGAHTRNDLASLTAWRADLPQTERDRVTIHGADQVNRLIQTDIYRGAMLQEGWGALHPAKYVRALARRARELGVAIHTGWRWIGGTGGIARLQGPEGTVVLRPDMVLIAVNGYAGPELPWLRRRIVPVQSYMIATAPQPFDAMEALIPGNRVVADTKHVLYYFRRSPDGTRMLFGGRARFRSSTEVQSAEGLRAFMAHTFPSLARAEISHSWLGNVSFAMDFCTHLGRMPDGAFYSSCYNGNGISMATYMGHRIAEAMLGRSGHDRGVMNTRFPALPAYDGRPWFLPMVGSWYRFQDKWARWRD
ncbi:NAD(P)/FAD-dependent oxidoreductase [Gemmobacter serpentinus]|uniref:NAD(P)/FAD-dependent oxidoreductase n=1 Tax=Gemmobacter serpentinus TaxID=2652247 RepID=UPI00124BDA4B|nr:FAD-binding oxidoreductase [Gemmobacter serpentinus]